MEREILSIENNRWIKAQKFESNIWTEINREIPIKL